MHQPMVGVSLVLVRLREKFQLCRSSISSDSHGNTGANSGGAQHTQGDVGGGYCFRGARRSEESDSA